MKHLHNFLFNHNLLTIFCIINFLVFNTEILTAQSPFRIRMYVDAPFHEIRSGDTSEEPFPFNQIRNYGLGIEFEKKVGRIVNLSFNIMHAKNYYSPLLYTTELNFTDPTIRCSHLYTSVGLGFDIQKRNVVYYQPGINFIFSEFTKGVVTNEEHGKQESLKGKKLNTKYTLYHSFRYTRLVPINNKWNFTISGNFGFIRGEEIIKEFLQHENARLSIQLGFQYCFNK